MPEESLEVASIRRTRAARIAVLAGAAALIVAGGVWLARKPLVAGALRGACQEQGLDCSFRLSRLDFGGVTLRDLALRTPDSKEVAASARRLAVDLKWTSLFSPQAAMVGGEGLRLRLDATGRGPLLGDLAEVIANLPKRDEDQPPQAMPVLQLRDIELVAKTELGPVRAAGQVLTGEGGELDMFLRADPVRLQKDGAELSLAAAEFQATSDGVDLNGVIRIDLDRYFAPGSSIEDLNLSVTLKQDAGVLLGAGEASASTIDLPEARLDGAQATASLEAGALTLSDFAPTEWLSRVKRLTVSGQAGKGSLAGAGWSSGELKADLAAGASGGAGGDVSLLARGVTLDVGQAERFELSGRVDLPNGASSAAGRAVKASGTARLAGAKLVEAQRNALGEMLGGPLRGALPRFADAASSAARKAGERFELVLPWSFQLDDGGFDASALSGATIQAASGLSFRSDNAGEDRVFTWKSRERASWSAGGIVRVSGGGSPTLGVELQKAEGGTEAWSAQGGVVLEPWRVGREALGARLSDLSFRHDPSGGSATVRADLSFSGDLGGLSWNNARVSGDVRSEWSGAALRAEAEEGLKVAWSGLAAGQTGLGAGELVYSSDGPLAERRDGVIQGRGTFAAMAAPLVGKAFAGRINLAPMKLNWRAADAVVSGNLSAGPIDLSLEEPDHVTPIRVETLTGALELGRSWRLKGAFNGASVLGRTIAADSAGGEIALSGGRAGVDGVVRNVTLRLFDPIEADKRRFEPARFEGDATIRASVASFRGEVVLVEPKTSMLSLTGTHDLGSGVGGAEFNGALAFAPGLQPWRLSPLFRGPANVRGRLGLSGKADWNGETAAASGAATLEDLGFALASSGVFEGVSGRVEIADLLNLRSEPGQTITLRKVTLGAPFENGVIQFQLAGYDGVKLERANWPFAGGELRVRPSDLSFDVEGTHLVAEAADWDLATLVDIFKIPDIDVSGRVNGRFPVTFTTGSARVDQAILLASEQGGVIKYTGSTGDAAANADRNAKLLFDALKDFRFKVLKLQLDGDLAGKMLLTLNLEGSNPAVLSNGPFRINIGLESELLSLLNTQGRVNRIVEQVVGEKPSGAGRTGN